MRVIVSSFIAVALLSTIANSSLLYPKSTKPLQESIVVKDVTTEEVLRDVYQLPSTKARLLAIIIDDASEVENVPTDQLIALISVESSFKHNLVSSEGAIGYGQVIPKYWNGITEYNVYDKYENIYLSAFILKEYQQQLGHWDAALRAYNVGITNYRNNNSQSAQQRYIVKITNELNKIQQYKAKQQLSEELIVGI